jgi:hypothetical protein
MAEKLVGTVRPIRELRPEVEAETEEVLDPRFQAPVSGNLRGDLDWAS